MSTKIDLTNQRFGSLLVIERFPRNNTKGRNTHWLCHCNCGRFLIVRSDNLRKGRSTQRSKCRGNAGRKSVFTEGGVDSD